MTAPEYSILNGHLGYGNIDAKIVFVGLEEACNPSTIAANYNYRIANPGLIKDLNDFHLHSPIPDMNQWYTVPKKQTTWGHLSKLILLNKGNTLAYSSDSAITLDYQVNKLGRLKEETLLVELFGLPRPNHSSWISTHMSSPTQFSTLRDYLSHPSILDRVRNIRDILNKRSRSVIVYGKSKHTTVLDHFTAIGDPLIHTATHPLARAEEYSLTTNPSVKFFLIPHVTMGMSNPAFESLAKLI